MEDRIKLNSRYGENNYLKKIIRADGEESKTYLLKTASYCLRMGYIDNLHKFIDPSGGPMIVEGHLLEEAEAVVKSIDHVMGKGYIITFE